jgi:hypothetical protein
MKLDSIEPSGRSVVTVLPGLETGVGKRHGEEPMTSQAIDI